MKKTLLLLFFGAGAISMISMSMHYYFHESTGIMKGKEISSMLWYRCVLRTHISFGIIGMLTGPAQFIQRLRISNPLFHQKVGYIYTGSILSSGLAGLVIAPWSMGGLVSALGFSTLAICWIVITLGAVIAIIKRRIRLHQLLMTLSFSLTFSTIPQRTMLLTALFTDIEFITIYRLSAWLPWMLNLMIAFVIFKKSSHTISQVS